MAFTKINPSGTVTVVGTVYHVSEDIGAFCQSSNREMPPSTVSPRLREGLQMSVADVLGGGVM